jgi:hypothetical protein
LHDLNFYWMLFLVKQSWNVQHHWTGKYRLLIWRPRNYSLCSRIYWMFTGARTVIIVHIVTWEGVLHVYLNVTKTSHFFSWFMNVHIIRIHLSIEYFLASGHI